MTDIDKALGLKASADATAPTTTVTAAALSARYANLLVVSSSLSGYGQVVKVIGLVVGILGIVGAISASDLAPFYKPMAVASGVFAVVFGVVLHVLGTFISAIGESLLALADIPTNTGKWAAWSS
ncbi:MAG: hypothetical protein ACHREM_28575 [Polyangiales bacterium]